MTSLAQLIIAIGVAGLLLLVGVIGVIWALRCDPKRPHYRLPALVLLSGPISLALLKALKVF